MSDIIVSGYHGFANSGDEALLWAILQSIRKQNPDIDFTVLSKTPEETARVYSVNSINRYNLLRVVRAMKNSKMLLFGGGSLLQDVTSSKSIKYYLLILWLAKRFGLKTMLYANGIGPVVKRENRFLATKILNKIDLITLRDDNSDEELKKLGVTKPEIKITADPVFTMDTDTSLSGKYFLRRAGVSDGAKVAVISLREWKTACSDFTEILSKVCDYLYEKHGIVSLFVPMQYPHDLDISGEVMSRMKNRAYLINRELSVPEMLSVLSEAELVIGMRLHSLIYATTLEKPAMALVYDPKVSAFMQSLSQPDFADVETLSFEEACAILDGIVDNKDTKSTLLHETNLLMRKKAQENAGYAIELLDK